jgi:CubicO group peptidase (beta-lactamase class C family)
MSDVHEHIQEAIDQLVESGAELGLQVAVYQHGSLVVDAVSGVADPATGRPVASDTPFYVTSTAKGVTSTVVHVLVERGVLQYDHPIVDLWPEFGAHGKQGATLRHVLTHSIGVPGVPADTTVEDLCDWEKMCAVIADTEPWWEPGTKTGYHPQTFGYIVGEVVRRATGKPISQVLREDVAAPLGVADELFLAVGESELARVARLEEAEGNREMMASLPEDFPLFAVAPPAVQPTAEFGNRADVLTSEGTEGTMTARAVARMYAALLGEVDGVRLVSPERLHQITAVAMTGVDEILQFPSSRALGYDVGFPGPLDSPTLFGMAGSGGTAAYADTATGVAVAVTKNRVTYGEFNAFNQVGDIVTKALDGR